MESSGRKRESLPLDPEDWEALSTLAEALGALYGNRPSWRTMIRQIARGELLVVKADTEIGRQIKALPPPPRVVTAELTGPDKYYSNEAE